MSATANKVLGVAAKEVGYYRPVGSATKYGSWYGIPTGSWCAMFVSWVAKEAGAEDIIPKHAWTPSGVAWFMANGQWTNGLRGVKRGDIVYFNFPGLPNRVSHVGFVTSVNSDGSVNTIEGNTSGTAGGNQRNGGLCARKRRKAYIVGYGRPKYKAPAKKKLEIDGAFGSLTATEWQDQLGRLAEDGLFKQDSANRLRVRLNAKNGHGGFKLVSGPLKGKGELTRRDIVAVQKLLNVWHERGVLDLTSGPLKLTGKLDSRTVKALQKSLNAGLWT